MTRTSAVIGLGITLLAGACGGDEQLPTGMSPAVQAARPAAGLKVTPAQLNLSGTGATATLTVSQGTGAVSVEVSTPACVSVVLKSAKANQSKYTVSGTAAGSCTLTVTDEGTGNVQVPVSVASTVVPTTLAAGLFHTCGLDATGAAYCWGKNDYGQLGNSTNLGIITANPTPGAVGGGVTFASLTAGGHHTCGLTPGGAAWCWGANWSGQLGNLTNSGVPDVSNPTPLPVDGNLTFAKLEAGEDHTCGITPQGVAHCWGLNSGGQLGTTTNNGVGTANPTPAPVDGGLTFLAIGAGASHTCGVATGGIVYCWGNNSIGQLGNADGIGSGTAYPSPTAVQGAPTLASFAAGRYHSCGLTPAGAAWCWGENAAGQLGATTPETIHPTPVAVVGGLSFVSPGAGAGHSCGLTSGGTTYCWGQNVAGQLGNITNFGSAVLSYSPIEVSGLSLVAIAVRGNHGCGLTSAGQAWCWGDNRYGQLGTSTNNNTGIGVPIAEAVVGLTFATP